MAVFSYPRNNESCVTVVNTGSKIDAPGPHIKTSGLPDVFIYLLERGNCLPRDS